MEEYWNLPWGQNQKRIEKHIPKNRNCLQEKDLICKIGAWKKGWGMCDEAHDMELVLTEFSDPGGKSVYFNISNKAVPVEDELFKKNR